MQPCAVQEGSALPVVTQRCEEKHALGVYCITCTKM